MKKCVRHDVVDFEVANDKGHFHVTFDTGVRSRKTPKSVKVELEVTRADGSKSRLQTRGIDLGGLTFGTTRASYLKTRDSGEIFVKKDINIGIITKVFGDKLHLTLDTDDDNNGVSYKVTRLVVVK